MNSNYISATPSHMGNNDLRISPMFNTNTSEMNRTSFGGFKTSKYNPTDLTFNTSMLKFDT